jgi:NAD(P)-dependent dehydrogenase (short-subunit alcohol dehydrogenase family)
VRQRTISTQWGPGTGPHCVENAYDPAVPRWTANDIPDQTGRTVVITGANTGLGLASARALAARGARVVLTSRDETKGAAALQAVKADATGPAPELVKLDLADLDAVRSSAERLLADIDQLDVLLNNAGVMAMPLRRTAQGFEMQVGTNHLGHFALTGLLLPILLRAPAARVVTVSSVGHRMGRVHLDDLSWDNRRYQRWLSYGQSKLANLLFTTELQRRAGAESTSLMAVAAHPGNSSTELGRHVPGAGLTARFPVFERLTSQSAEMGALPQLYAATMPDVAGNDYWGPDGLFEQRGHPKKVGRSRAATDAEMGRGLWELSERLTGVTYDFAGLK